MSYGLYHVPRLVTGGLRRRAIRECEEREEVNKRYAKGNSDSKSVDEYRKQFGRMYIVNTKVSEIPAFEMVKNHL